MDLLQEILGETNAITSEKTTKDAWHHKYKKQAKNKIKPVNDDENQQTATSMPDSKNKNKENTVVMERRAREDCRLSTKDRGRWLESRVWGDRRSAVKISIEI